MPAPKDKSIRTRPDSIARRELFCQAFCVCFNSTQAAKEAGFSQKRSRVTGSELLDEPGIQARVKEIIDGRAAQIQSREFDVLAKVREVVERCMQAAPVTDRRGNAVEGEWQFDSNAALRGLELLGKHEGLFAATLNVTLTEVKARETIKRAVNIVGRHVTPEVFRAIVADLEGAGDA